MSKVYVISALRWGSNENHSYNLGVYSTLEKAIKIADEHCSDRGGKYECIVEECILDQCINKKEIYCTDNKYHNVTDKR